MDCSSPVPICHGKVPKRMLDFLEDLNIDRKTFRAKKTLVGKGRGEDAGVHVKCRPIYGLSAQAIKNRKNAYLAYET